MEKIDKFFPPLQQFKFNNLTVCYDLIKLNNSLGSGKLNAFVGISTFFILLTTVINIKSNRKLSATFHHGLENKILINPAYYLLICLMLPPLMLSLLFCMLIREVVRIILKLKHGNLFGGFLESADAVWAIEGTSRSVINIIITISMKSDRSANLNEDIKKLVFEKVFKQPDLFPKLTSKHLSFMGYCYLLKNQITVDDCVFRLKHQKEIDTLNEGLLQELVSEYSDRPLPKQNSALWEILISPIPIQTTANEKENTRFPVLLRFSHIVGDGISLTNFLSKSFCNFNIQESDLIQKITNVHLSCPNNGSVTGHRIIRLITSVKCIFTFIGIILTAPAVIMHQNFIRKDINALHASKLSGKKIFVRTVEKESKLIPLIKKIKKSVPESRFSDVLLTAISRSLNNYFKGNSSPIPHFVTAVVTALMSAPDMNESDMLQNNFSVGLLELPVLIESKSIKKRLQCVMKQTNKLRTSPDYQVNYWLLKRFCGIIPVPLLRFSLQTNTMTMTVSSVPGLPKLSILNEYEIEDIIFYTPHRGTVGVGFTIITYDDRFQLGLAVDKSIISSTEIAQSIVNDIFENVNLLYEEVFSSIHPQNGKLIDY